MKVCEPPGSNLRHIILRLFLDPVLLKVSQVVVVKFFLLSLLQKMHVDQGWLHSPVSDRSARSGQVRCYVAVAVSG